MFYIGLPFIHQESAITTTTLDIADLIVEYWFNQDDIGGDWDGDYLVDYTYPLLKNETIEFFFEVNFYALKRQNLTF